MKNSAGEKPKPQPLLPITNVLYCFIIERLNRFVIRIEINGRAAKAHLNNTGRLEQFISPGRKAFCWRPPTPGKTDFRLFAIEEREQGAVVDTQLQMKAFEAALEKNLLPWLKNARLIKRNVRLGVSVLDYLLEKKGEPLYLEIKSAVFRENNHALYPDCPSQRGQKHIKELINLTKQGGQGLVVFMAALPEVKAFKPNLKADSILYKLLKTAQRAGLGLKALNLYYHPQDSYLYLENPELKIIF